MFLRAYLQLWAPQQVRGPMVGRLALSGPRIYYGVHLGFRAAGSLTMADKTPFFMTNRMDT